MILETQDPVTASLAALVVRAAGGGRKLLPIFSYANAAGICRAVKDTEPVEILLAAAAQGEVDALLVLGGDPVRGGFGEDMRSARASVRFLAAGAPFENETTEMADLVLPTALWLEAEGTYNNVRLRPAVEPPGEALACGELLRRLAVEMGRPLPPAAVEPAGDEGEPSVGMVEKLAAYMVGEPLAPEVRSSTVRYGDGSLTDHMGWYTFSGVNGW
jgi:anaerobic selenocysteine-containing dehydrogenase